MGKRGPAPEPTKLKVIKGARPSTINDRAPQPRDALPQPTRHLSPYGQEVWDYIIAELDPMRIVTAADRDQLACYCEAVAAHWRATDILAHEDFLVDGQNAAMVKNPIIQVQRDAATLVKSFAAEFGLTPRARADIRMPEATEASSAEALLS